VIRHADPKRDAAACAAIYAPWVANSVVSFEREPPTAADVAERIERTSRTHAWLVLERDGAVAGYAYAYPHRARAAYQWAAEVSVYIDLGARRSGVGRELYTALFGLLRRQRIHVVYAGLTLPNPASEGLHRAMGFARVGVYERVGWKTGGWHDVAWYGLELLPRVDGAPPEPPLGPQRLGEG
jgi:L-amino acid N-acyltransferase YncA